MKQKYSIFLAFIIFINFGCQNDDFQFDYDTTTTISSTSLLSSYLQRSLQNESTKDNFIDGSSAVKIEFPYSIQINNQPIDLVEEDDYQYVIQFLEDENLSFYEVEFSFPLQVSSVNYETTTVQSLAEFENIIATNTASSEINCISFNYPVEVNSFNLSDENSTTRIVNNQAQFYNFLNLLEQQNGFFQFIYPFNLNANGEEVEINAVVDLENIYNNLAAACFEPNLFIPNSPISQLENFLIGESFFVFNLFDDGEDETDNVEDFSFLFNANGSIDILNNQTQSSTLGSWNIEVVNDEIELILDFENSELTDLEDDWLVEEFGTDNQILLTDDDDILIFQKIE